MTLTSNFFYKHRDDLLFVALGGANKIGLNVSLYHYLGKWLMIDCGSGYVNARSNKLIIPDLTFIEKNRDNLLGLIITHAHEDHIGAIAYTWNMLKCPIFATAFAISILKNHLKDTRFFKEIRFIPITHNKSVSIGPFVLEFYPVPHSIVESQAIAIRTKAGNIFHTGDWKYDTSPIIGSTINENSLAKYGREGILAIVSDSHGIFDLKKSISESEIVKSLYGIVSQCKGMVLLTTYPSNIARIAGIINIAEKIDKKIVISGTQILQTLYLAKKSGYLTKIKNLIHESKIHNFKREEIVVIASGCDGESTEAVASIALNKHKNIKLLPGDNVIFSSKITLRNTAKLNKIMTVLTQSGIHVITERDNLVHTHGHSTSIDIKKIYELLKPKICIPVHGTDLHLKQHQILAKECQIQHTFKTSNGDVISLNSVSPKVIAHIPTGVFAI